MAKRKYFVIISVLLALICFQSLALAQDTTTTTGSDEKSRIGGMWALGAGYGYVNSKGTQPKHQGNANVGFFFNDYIGMDIEAAITSGDTTMYSGFLDLIVRMPWHDLALYIKGGPGMQARTFSKFGNWDDSFAKRAGGGLEYFFTHNFAINIEALYVWAGSNTFDAPQYRGGLKLYF